MRDCGPIPLGPGVLLWLEAWRWRVIRRAGNWRRGRLRIIQWGKPPHYPTYIKITPNFGIGLAWFRNRKTKRQRRVRVAWHHGVQVIEWYGARWVVVKQVAGKSRVNKESFEIGVR